MKQRYGFTIIEVLVVVAIIGLLSALVMAKIAAARAISRDGMRKNDLEQLRNVLEAYNADTGSFPATTSGIHNNANGVITGLGNLNVETWQKATTETAVQAGQAVLTRPNNSTPYASTMLKALLDGKYLPEIPKPPQSTNYYVYGTNPNNTTIVDVSSWGCTPPWPVFAQSSIPTLLGQPANTQFILEAKLERPTISNRPYWQLRETGQTIQSFSGVFSCNSY